MENNKISDKCRQCK